MPRRRPFLPRKLTVLPEMPNKGTLEIRHKTADGKWIAHYDVTTPEGNWVGDVCPVTTEQVERWTGINLEDEEKLHG